MSKGDPKDQIEQILGVPEVDCGVDAVGFEARGHGHDSATEAPATVLNSKYHRGLMKAILADKVQIGDAVNATVISLDDARRGYAEFDSGVARKFILDPHNMTGKSSAA